MVLLLARAYQMYSIKLVAAPAGLIIHGILCIRLIDSRPQGFKYDRVPVLRVFYHTRFDSSWRQLDRHGEPRLNSLPPPFP